MINKKYINTGKCQFSSSTTSKQWDCKHNNGWYGNVRFWIFAKQIFMCSDCGEIIYIK